MRTGSTKHTTLAPFLRPGRNEIAATVWNLGVYAGAQISDRTAFVLAGDTEAEVSLIPISWEVEEDKGVQTLPTPPDIQRFYYVAEPAERIDGALFDWSWNDCSFFSWQMGEGCFDWKCHRAGSVLQNNNWQLMPDSLPAMQMELTPIGRVVRASGIQPPADFPGSRIRNSGSRHRQSAAGPVPFDYGVPGADGERRRREHDSSHLCGGAR